jgi:hypothetical protein
MVVPYVFCVRLLLNTVTKLYGAALYRTVCLRYDNDILNRSYGEMVCQNIAIYPDKADPNIIKMLKPVSCSSHDSAPLK